MKEKSSKFKVSTFIFWLLSAYIIFLSIYCIVLQNVATPIQLLFVFAVSCFIYIDIVLVFDYIKVNKILSQIKDVKLHYSYFQTYVDENTLVIETLKDEVTKLNEDLANLKIESKQISEDNKFVKYEVNLKQ